MEANRDFDVEPPLCATGCGFYGVREHRSLCSKCYVAFLRDQAAESAAGVATGQPLDLASGVAACLDDLVAWVGDLTLDDSTRTVVKKKNRCTVCDKRVGLLGFECRCGDVFCGAHRHPEEHDCDVDFKTAARRRLSEENPRCKADKMESRI